MPREHSPGFRFKQGKLYAFTEDSVFVLESWPVLRALRKTDGEPWTEFAPQFSVVQPYRPRKKAPPSHDYFGFMGHFGSSTRAFFINVLALATSSGFAAARSFFSLGSVARSYNFMG